ncbi:MAG: preprotein translocase subunit SecE [Candidatus Saccharimonadales bacterium]
MAKKSDTSTVTRVRSASTKTKKAVDSKTKAAKATKSVITGELEKRTIIRGFFDYFAGAWYELKQVRWPTRKATWGLTIAVLLFSLFFVVFILLLDAGFKYLFEQLLK